MGVSSPNATNATKWHHRIAYGFYEALGYVPKTTALKEAAEGPFTRGVCYLAKISP